MWSATQPVIGAPIGVVPRKATAPRASNLPAHVGRALLLRDRVQCGDEGCTSCTERQAEQVGHPDRWRPGDAESAEAQYNGRAEEPRRADARARRGHQRSDEAADAGDRQQPAEQLLVAEPQVGEFQQRHAVVERERADDREDQEDGRAVDGCGARTAAPRAPVGRRATRAATRTAA